jgi:dynein heavy chain
VFAFDDKVYIYGGWNSEMQFNNVMIFNLQTNEWSDPDIYNDIHRWNHCSVLVEAIPTWKFFIFGGECAEYNEGTPRAFGEYVNSSCYLDLGTVRWTTYASDPEQFENIPSPREYASMAYDQKDNKILVYGGWNNGWFNDLHSLNVGKIVGPSYAITATDPCMGQLTGRVPLRITGQGFKDAGSITVFFSNGNKPVDSQTKNTVSSTAEFVSETEIICMTPSFESFGKKAHEAVMQVQIGSGDFTTTWIPFNYFLNTRAANSLAYGPGLLEDVAPGTPVEFLVQARNDENKNRQSGRDKFEVRIRKIRDKAEAVVEEEEPAEEEEELDEDGEPIVREKVQVRANSADDKIDCEVVDTDQGFYKCKYVMPDEGKVRVEVLFEDDKQNMVHIRGSPYKASFNSAAKPAENTMTGGALERHVKAEIQRLQDYMTLTKKDVNTKDKDMKDVKQLLGVKETVEGIVNNSDKTTLSIDQLDEALLLF